MARQRNLYTEYKGQKVNENIIHQLCLRRNTALFLDEVQKVKDW